MVYINDEKVEIIFIFAYQNEWERVKTRLLNNERYPDGNVSYK